MASAVDKETTIIARCTALGLSRPQALALADAGPFPYNRFPYDLAFMLGLDSETLTPQAPKPWLWMAARTASVSYRGTLTPETLLGALVIG